MNIDKSLYATWRHDIMKWRRVSMKEAKEEAQMIECPDSNGETVAAC